MAFKNLKELYLHELVDLYSAEKQLTEALPKMVQAASDSELQKAFSAHLEETKGHMEKVHNLLKSHDENPGNTKCDAMAGLIEEGEGMIKEKAPASVKDAGLIMAAQRVEHYEMSGYGSARAHAEALGLPKDVIVLDSILGEESKAHDKLNRLALDKINPAAIKAA